MAPLLPIAGAAVRAVAAGGARAAAGAVARGAATSVARGAATSVARSTASGVAHAGSGIAHNVANHSGVAGSQQFSHTSPAGGARNDGITFDTSPRETGMAAMFGGGRSTARGVSTLDTDGFGDFKTGGNHPAPPEFHNPPAHMAATATTVAMNTQSMEKSTAAPIGKGSNKSRWLFGAEEGAASPSFTSAAFGRPGG